MGPRSMFGRCSATKSRVLWVSTSCVILVLSDCYFTPKQYIDWNHHVVDNYPTEVEWLAECVPLEAVEMVGYWVGSEKWTVRAAAKFSLELGIDCLPLVLDDEELLMAAAVLNALRFVPMHARVVSGEMTALGNIGTCLIAWFVDWKNGYRVPDAILCGINQGCDLSYVPTTLADFLKRAFPYYVGEKCEPHHVDRVVDLWRGLMRELGEVVDG